MKTNRKRKAATKRPPSFLCPTRMYSLQGFRDCTGFTPQREWEAAQHGVKLKKLYCGRRVFIKGSDAIAYVEAVAELTARQQAEAAR